MIKRFDRELKKYIDEIYKTSEGVLRDMAFEDKSFGIYVTTACIIYCLGQRNFDAISEGMNSWLIGECIGESDGYADGFPVYDTWHCSQCDYAVESDQIPAWNFCPNCGSYIRVKEKEENDLSL